MPMSKAETKHQDVQPHMALLADYQSPYQRRRLSSCCPCPSENRHGHSAVGLDERPHMRLRSSKLKAGMRWWCLSRGRSEGLSLLWQATIAVATQSLHQKVSLRRGSPNKRNTHRPVHSTSTRQQQSAHLQRIVSEISLLCHCVRVFHKWSEEVFKLLNGKMHLSMLVGTSSPLRQ